MHTAPHRALVLAAVLILPASTALLHAQTKSAEGVIVAPAPASSSPNPGQDRVVARGHAGLQALFRATAADFAAFPRRRSTWVILGIGAGAAALGHPADDDTNRHLVGSPSFERFWTPGKWIGAPYVQAGTGAALYLLGRYVLPRPDGESRTSRVSHLGIDLVRAQVVSQAIVLGMKNVTRRERPTGECCAFPSGHAATAFATAAVLERHFGYRRAWPTLLAAAYVGTSRLHDNRHFLSDVLFGSAVGIATGWVVVGRHGRSEFAVTPAPVRGGIALMFTRQPARTGERE
ncbi:MAG: phosphatase PAP2 family protein [Acidobacteria bacterium]|nr:phosphatase PAP2 family protein [Acidobacteriota bacterium]